VAGIYTIASGPAISFGYQIINETRVIDATNAPRGKPADPGGTSAIWSYNGGTPRQITPSTDHVDSRSDFNIATAPYPMASYNGDLVFSEATLASNTAAADDRPGGSRRLSDRPAAERAGLVTSGKTAGPRRPCSRRGQ
jgi:hypothetical protein